MSNQNGNGGGIGPNKAVAALAAGVLMPLILIPLQKYGIDLGQTWDGEAQGLITAILVYYLPHSLGA